MKLSIAINFILLLLGNICYASSTYDYPIENAFVATVVGTPSEYVASLPKDIPRQENDIVIFPDRKTNDFFPNKKLRYTLASQKNEAPLVFSIAGTGASHRSPKMLLLEKSFYQAGFHVVSLSSPTCVNFIATASGSQVPGHISHDSADLYHVMKLIYGELNKKIEVSEFYLTGYSLGGAQAAFISKLDESEKVFNFSKVLMINPPVNLFNSASILDHLLEDNIPGGMTNFNAFFDELMNDFTKVYKKLERIDFNDNFLYRIYKYQNKELNDQRVSAVIGMSFRLSAANMMFSSDMVTGGGYILPKNHQLKKTESTTKYFKVANRKSFANYFSERFYPFFKSENSEISRDSLMYDNSLISIEGYLKSTEKIAVVHNEDDIILAPGEIDFFRNTFLSRAKIYPRGGHCGNIAHKDNVDYMIKFFSN